MSPTIDEPKLRLDKIGLKLTSAQGAVHTVFEGIDVSIDKGSFVSVIGPSGCGKTSILNVIAGLVKPTFGQVLVDGERVLGPSPQRGVVFQQYALFPWLTVRKNIEFGIRMAGGSTAIQKEVSDSLLERMGLEQWENAFPKELSGGMKQRVALARAYAVAPDILLMDEPFGALDSETRVRLQDELVSMWFDRRTTVVFITHDIEEAIFLAQRVLVMGGTPGQIVNDVSVDLPHPRSSDVRVTEEFGEIRRKLWSALHDGQWQQSFLSHSDGVQRKPTNKSN